MYYCRCAYCCALICAYICCSCSCCIWNTPICCSVVPAIGCICICPCGVCMSWCICGIPIPMGGEPNSMAAGCACICCSCCIGGGCICCIFLRCASTPSAISCARAAGETLGLTLALFTTGDRAATFAAGFLRLSRSYCCRFWVRKPGLRIAGSSSSFFSFLPSFCASALQIRHHS